VSPEGTYAVGPNPQAIHPGATQFAACGDHTSGMGSMLIANGATQPNTVVWGQSVTVLPYHRYELTIWATAVIERFPIQLKLAVNGEPVGVLEVSTAVCQWQPITVDWASGTNTTALVSLIDLNIEAFGNDFAVDDISLVAVGLALPGTPGTATCHSDIVATLSEQFGGLSAAATALGFPSVPALQQAIQGVCDEDRSIAL
jgi:hypothetical protein